MRRIPRPQRPFDSSITSTQLPRSRVPCRAALPSGPLLRSTSAPFSTTTRRAFLSGERDKKKHQAFVRRWQKRLLGDSEPIGAHVDPYDATSPVRIAPEETGEEVEVLEESTIVSAPDEQGRTYDYESYVEADSGEGLLRVGGKKWNQERLEAETIERYEMLLARPYPVAEYGFGPDRKITDRAEIVALFHQAVVEVYTLQNAGSKIDVAAYPKRGDYETLPFNFSAVKLTATQRSAVTLQYPYPEAETELLNALRDQPEELSDTENPVSQLEEGAVGEAVIVGTTKSTETTTATTTAPAIALVKRAEGNPFDFMSNRPVPRAKPAEPKQGEAQATKPAKTTSPVPEFDIESAAEDSRKAVADLQQIALDADTQRVTDAIAALRKEVHTKVTSPSSQSAFGDETVNEIKYRHVPLTDARVKFALSKRLTQLTGLRISDPLLNSSNTLGDLYGNLIKTSKPKHTKLFDIKLEDVNSGKCSQTTFQPNVKTFERVRGEQEGVQVLASLQELPNLKVYSKRLNREFNDMKVGRGKVIDYALAERGLPLPNKRVREVRTV